MLSKQKAYVLMCIGFLLVGLVSCTEEKHIDHSSAPHMGNPFPFDVRKIDEIEPQTANRRFCIQTPVGEIEGYHELFEEFGFGGNGPSWVEHIHAILEEKDSDLLDHLEFDEEGDTFLVYADSEDVVNRFMKHAQPVFATKKSLKKYLKQADPDNFSE